MSQLREKRIVLKKNQDINAYLSKHGIEGILILNATIKEIREHEVLIDVEYQEV